MLIAISGPLAGFFHVLADQTIWRPGAAGR